MTLPRVVRSTRAADAVAISDILCRAFDSQNQRWSPDAVTGMLGQAGTVGLVAESGCAIIRTIAGEAELLTIAVRPDARRAGSGAALLAASIDAARAGGARRMFLEVAADNPGAIALYDGAGFVKVGRRVGYYRRPGANIDALIMALDLAG